MDLDSIVSADKASATDGMVGNSTVGVNATLAETKEAKASVSDNDNDGDNQTKEGDAANENDVAEGGDAAEEEEVGYNTENADMVTETIDDAKGSATGEKSNLTKIDTAAMLYGADTMKKYIYDKVFKQSLGEEPGR